MPLNLHGMFFSKDMGKLLPNGRNSFGRCLTRQDFKINMRKMDEDGSLFNLHTLNESIISDLMTCWWNLKEASTKAWPIFSPRKWYWCQSFAKMLLVVFIQSSTMCSDRPIHAHWEAVQPLSGMAFQTNKGPSPLSGYAFLGCRRSVQDLCHLQFFLLNQLTTLEWGAGGSHCFAGSRDGAA